ncbi:MAG TPA: DUF2723 domain-containing protein [Elusimicrobiota bacterium]|nr:DUF2723 domain-containing protein [Elusimicrobiota bacterium]
MTDVKRFFMETPPGWRWAAPSVLFLVLWFFYVRGAQPCLAPGDSAELTAAAATLGVAHSPGYPFYVLLGNVFGHVVPWGNPAFRMNLFSGFSTALALALLACLWRSAPAPAHAVLLLAGLSPLFLKLSTAAEVFGLNVLAVGVLALALGKFCETVSSRWFLLSLFLFGLWLGNQQTLILVFPFLFLWGVGRLRVSGGLKGGTAFFRFLAAVGVFFFLGLTVYVFLYLRSRSQPLLDWEDPETWDRFWKVLSRARYGTLQLAQGTPPPHDWNALWTQLRFFGDKTLENWRWGGLALLLTGGTVWMRRGIREGGWARQETVWFLGALACGPLFLFWANIRPEAATREMLERFLFLPLFMLVFVGVEGFLFLWRTGRWGKIVGALCLFQWTAVVFANGSLPSDRWDLAVGDHGRNVLRTAPSGAYLFADRADETEFSLAYLMDVAFKRPDVDFVDANAGVSRSLYGKDYYEVWGKPRLARRQRVEGGMLASTSRPFYYATLDVSQLALPRRAAGLLFEASPSASFSSRTAFPYWDVYLWRWPDGPMGARELHLAASTSRLMGDYAFALNDLRQAERFIRMGEKAGMSPWDFYLATWHHRQGHWAEAERLYRRLAGRPGSEAVAWNNLGVLCSDQNKFQEALRYYRKAIERDPRYAEAYYNSGVVYWRLGDWRAVMENLEQVLRWNPAHPEARKFLLQARRRLSGGS